jgi:tripartite-type tricarboxylate transporter receptor subunit TctC
MKHLVDPHAVQSPAASRRRQVLRGGAAGLAALAALAIGRRAGAARSDPIQLLCSGPAGSIPDLICRSVAEQLASSRGQRAIVDNRPGAAGQLGVGALKAAPADGNTLLLAQGAIATVYPHLYPKLAYDALADLAPVSLAGEMTLALAVGPAVPAAVTDVGELLQWLRSHPALANLGSPGTGTLPHLLAAMLLRAADTPWQHIPYSGGPPAVSALLGGQIAALVLPEGLLSSHRAGGRLRVLATSGTQRTALMPDVSTLVEQGHADLVVREWFAFFMSSKAASERVEEWSRTLQAVLAQPRVVAQFLASGMDAASSTPAALAARIAAERRSWAPVLRGLNLPVA